MKNTDVKILYPNFSTKAVTFTIDDGNIPMDERFISITKPGGIKGTFNLCSDRLSDYPSDFFRDFYSGYEIANHCKHHPYATDDAREYTVCPEGARDSAQVSAERLYKNREIEGMYDFLTERGWRSLADDDTYIRLADESRRELEAVFGEGSVGSYVWPYSRQNNARVISHLRGSGYYAIRQTGCTLDSTGFALPADWSAWSYNADNRNLLEVMAKYDAYVDDGELKFFAFGVHSQDFERDGNWGDLKLFTELYGSRPADFWYATVGEIYCYTEAAGKLQVSDTELYNPTDMPIYVKIPRGVFVVGAGERLSL